jgi:hypothetical protein
VQLCAHALLQMFAAAVSISLRNYTRKEQKMNHVAQELVLSGSIMKKCHPASISPQFPSCGLFRPAKSTTRSYFHEHSCRKQTLLLEIYFRKCK